MWFKQVTCDHCFTPLDSQGRHNHFYFAKIIKFERVNKDDYFFRSHEFNNPNEFRFNYDTSMYSDSNWVYCYHLERLTPNKSTWFCDRKCALAAAEESDSVLFYYDNNDGAIAMITPQQREINALIDENYDTPLLLLGIDPSKWFDTDQNYQDLTVYGTEKAFPVLFSSNLRLIKPSSCFLSAHQSLIMEDSFLNDFYGSSSFEVKEKVKEGLEDFLIGAEIDYGRRMQIDWFIIENDSQYIGFIRMTCKQPAFPYKWMIEFGLLPNYRQRGIMSKVVAKVINWAKLNGCNEIYAISENHNTPAHLLLRHTGYPTIEGNMPMTDQYGGLRPMKQFRITLE